MADDRALANSVGFRLTLGRGISLSSIRFEGQGFRALTPDKTPRGSATLSIGADAFFAIKLELPTHHRPQDYAAGTSPATTRTSRAKAP